jgi:hypothetical protein
MGGAMGQELQAVPCAQRPGTARGTGIGHDEVPRTTLFLTPAYAITAGGAGLTVRVWAHRARVGTRRAGWTFREASPVVDAPVQAS